MSVPSEQETVGKSENHKNEEDKCGFRFGSGDEGMKESQERGEKVKESKDTS